MTFKHIKFADSPVMRSFERVSLEKGLIKADPIVKEASAKVQDLTATNNLLVDILKLSEGLRSQGFGKYADELEEKLLAYKTACYNTSKETGEDLINEAHPEGSVKIDVVGNPVIHTILDTHLKMVEMVNKPAKGKLMSSKSIINAVKLALAAPETDLKNDYNSLVNEINNFLDYDSDNKISSITGLPIADPFTGYSIKTETKQIYTLLKKLLINSEQLFNAANPLESIMLESENARTEQEQQQYLESEKLQADTIISSFSNLESVYKNTAPFFYKLLSLLKDSNYIKSQLGEPGLIVRRYTNDLESLKTAISNFTNKIVKIYTFAKQYVDKISSKPEVKKPEIATVNKAEFDKFMNDKMLMQRDIQTAQNEINSSSWDKNVKDASTNWLNKLNNFIGSVSAQYENHYNKTDAQENPKTKAAFLKKYKDQLSVADANLQKLLAKLQK